MKDNSWVNEHDQAFWVDKETGYWCRITRVPNLRHLCGYVAIPKGHPYYGKHTWRTEPNVEVHGGITWSKSVKRDKVAYWEYGFDCAHLGDYAPGCSFPQDDGFYRDWDYVKHQVLNLAKQLKELEK